MIFRLREENGFLPDLVYGDRGRELRCFIPIEYSWKQLNYGQGEGQVLINGSEWGFYYSSYETIDVILHDQATSQKEALQFAHRVCEHVYKDRYKNVVIEVIEPNKEKNIFSKIISKLGIQG